LVEKGYSSLLIFGIDHIDDHLHVDVVFSAISPRDESIGGGLSSVLGWGQACWPTLS
jgi:hypothetical protein